ncbi:MAG: hypothetical protein ACLSCV_09620 [Acutalibacteraceae bacterium]
MAHGIFERLGIRNLSLINSIGCPECRAKYHAALKLLEASKSELCDTCLDVWIKIQCVSWIAKHRHAGDYQNACYEGLSVSGMCGAFQQYKNIWMQQKLNIQ